MSDQTPPIPGHKSSEPPLQCAADKFNERKRSQAETSSPTKKQKKTEEQKRRRTARRNTNTTRMVPIELETQSFNTHTEESTQLEQQASLRIFNGSTSVTNSLSEDQECLLYDVALEFQPEIYMRQHPIPQPPTPTQPYPLPAAPSCRLCGARRFRYETPGFCCSKGAVALYPIETSEKLDMLYTESTPEALHFKQYILAFNSLFSFTSFGVNLDPLYATNNRGIYTFRAQGQIYHSLQTLTPLDNHPSHLQLYFYDTTRELEHRLYQKSQLLPSIVTSVMEILSENPYSQFFRSLTHIPNLQDYKINLKIDPCIPEPNTAPPTVSQVAAIWLEDESATEVCERHILVQQHNGFNKAIRYYYGCYDSLQYPLLFPKGEPGWHRGIKRRKKTNPTGFCQGQGKVLPSFASTAEDILATEEAVCADTGKSSATISACEYYAYRMQIRPSINSILLHAGRLFQQYVVDMYVKIETSRLDYFRNHQKEIRADLYNGIVDSVNRGETQSANIGARIVLPGSFIGGPRDMRKRYMDAMTLVERYGKPDLFLTMTCNPNWPEIKNELQYLELAQNRPDLCVRIFRAKFQELRNDIVKKKLFGVVTAYTFVIEFQKRGLPHVHMLLILSKEHKLKHANQFDGIISAEIPDKEKHPHLYNMVIKHMMHGPCGNLNKNNVCMKKGSCKNKYPKNYCPRTTMAVEGYPLYRRQQGNDKVKVRGNILDNRWVVPYNPYLLAKYDCHINVEVCATIKAIKYLYKYIYKGHDQIIYQIVHATNDETIDEIGQFQKARWITPPEALWRIFQFPLHEMSPPVITLQVHEEGNHRVTLNPYTNLASIASNEFYSRTMLTQFFWMNKYNGTAQQLKLLYRNFPEFFVWDAQSKKWSERKQQKVIGRMATANPNQGERYYLRLLLDYVHAPKSYQDLRSANGILYATNRQAAIALKLLEDDKASYNCMHDAVGYQMPASLRQFFCTILIHCSPANPKQLFLEFEDPMIEDYLHIQRMQKDTARQLLLATLATELQSMGKTLENFELHSFLTDDILEDNIPHEIRNEMEIPVSEIDLASVACLNQEQKAAYNDILKSVFDNKAKSFFIDGPGGTGKTFLYKALLANIRSQKMIALATATSGIAASILPNGRTAHSRFKIPINGDGKIACNVTNESDLGQLLQQTSLIIWDEASMAKRQSIEALDQLLRDLLRNKELFGGKVVVLGGDFRQVLPVISKGTKEDCMDASLIRSPIWPKLKKYTLTINMRAITDPTFSNYLLRIGNGTEKRNPIEQISLPDALLLHPLPDIGPLQQLIDFVFPNISLYETNAVSMIDSAILTPTNETVDKINETMLSKLPGQESIYLFYNETDEINEQGLYLDFLNSITPQGMPQHKLVLKVNSPIIMLRNLNPSKGLCNGTRLICRNFTSNIIVAEIAVGQRKGDMIFIPRIPFKPNDPHQYPVNFTRRQFPVRLCFAMTINKSQCQTLNKVGIYLPQPVFAHGQLYVALSRATKADNVRVILEQSTNPLYNNTYTDNIVYTELLHEANLK